MGCNGYKIQQATELRKRMQKNSFTIPGYNAGVYNIDKYKLLCVVTDEKISFIDYNINKTKFEQAFDFISEDTFFQFSEKDDTLEIKCINLQNSVCIVKFNLGDKITQILKDVQEYKPAQNSWEKICIFENGNSIVYKPLGLENSNEKCIQYLDKSGNILGEVKVPKDIFLLDKWHNDYYVVLLSYDEIYVQLNREKRKASKMLYLYKLNNFSKVGEIQIKRAGINLEAKKVLVEPVNDKTLICSFFAEVNLVDLETFQITKKITFCDNEKSFCVFLKEGKDTFWCLSETGHLHKWKLDGTQLLVKNVGYSSSHLAIIKGGKEIAILVSDCDKKNKKFSSTLIIESNE